jgi:hypothetical protein
MDKETTTLGNIVAVGFTGTQKGMTEAQRLSFLNLCDKFGARNGVWLNNGDCQGADTDAYHIWKSQGGRVYGHPPINPSKRSFLEFDDYNKQYDYLQRNRHIVDASDVLIGCCEFMHGTWSTIRYATKKGKLVYIIWPDGSVSVRNVNEQADPFEAIRV